jgi:hypothetical protein
VKQWIAVTAPSQDGIEALGVLAAHGKHDGIFGCKGCC